MEELESKLIKGAWTDRQTIWQLIVAVAVAILFATTL
jgi:hypothetical protein